MPVSIARWQSN